ncbi:MAG: hypothetical protein EA362_08440 [Saprospirales bacterium]|nr:MAG: hypothetical protein EA362_08440 [Saprospirales bacterium]
MKKFTSLNFWSGSFSLRELPETGSWLEYLPVISSIFSRFDETGCSPNKKLNYLWIVLWFGSFSLRELPETGTWLEYLPVISSIFLKFDETGSSPNKKINYLWIVFWSGSSVG